MKKNYFFQTALVVCSLAVTMMTSCKEDEKIVPATTVETGYYVKVSNEVLATTTVEAHYIDAKGLTCSEFITSPEWKKQLPKGSLPSLAALYIKFTPKNPETGTKYNMELTSCVAYRVENGTGKQWSDAWTTADNLTSLVEGENVEEWCNQHSVATAIEIQTECVGRLVVTLNLIVLVTEETYVSYEAQFIVQVYSNTRLQTKSK